MPPEPLTHRRTTVLGPLLLLLLGLSGACAHLPGLPSAGPSPSLTLWNEAHAALQAGQFVRSDSLFARLTTGYPESREGREALFYRGVIALDPRNPRWNPKPAEAELEQYVSSDTLPGGVQRLPEGETLLELARQLNLPAAERVPGLKPETRTVVTPGPARVITRAGEAQAATAEADRLRARLAERDEEIRRLREELDRIRKTLTPRPTP
jgi:hypothetical protein